MKRNQGFTLVELMIVVAILGIVVMISAGFYGDNVRATNRTEARSALNETAGSLEKCRSLYGTYTNGNCNVVLPFDTENNYYRVSGTTITDVTFTLTATPIAGQPQADDGDCTTLTLTNTGVKGATGADIDECW